MSKIARPLLALLSLALVTACENMQKAPSNYDPYVSNYGNDGGYNPYPGQPGYAQGGGATTPSYDLPPAPAEADPYAFRAPSSTSKPAATSSSSASKKPATTASKSKAAPKKAATSGTHTVVKGDTLYGIALKRKTTVAKIKAANGLNSDLIRPGQKLKIP